MAQVILPPTEILAAAAAALVAGTEDAARKRALDKAAFEYEMGLQLVESAGAYLVRSFTAPGLVYRVSSTGQCSCPAGEHGKPCKHAEAIAILVEAQRYAIPSLARMPSYDEAVAQMDELFA